MTFEPEKNLARGGAVSPTSSSTAGHDASPMTRIIRTLRGDGPFTTGLSMDGPYGRINYFLEGNPQGPLVMCLHGLNSAADQFAPLSSILTRQGFRVLRFDFWGHGLSAPLPKTRVPGSVYSDQIVHVLRRLQVSHIHHHVIGFSLGGFVAAQYAALPHSQVQKLILLSPAGLMTDKPKRIRLIALRFIGMLVYYFLILLHFCCCLFVNNKNMEAYYSVNEDTGVLDPGQRFWKKQSRRNLRTAFTVARSIPLWDNTMLFEKLANKIQFIMCAFGGADLITPPDSALPVLQKLFPELTVHVYDGCGHQILDEASPGSFIDIYSFLVNGVTRSPDKNLAVPSTVSEESSETDDESEDYRPSSVALSYVQRRVAEIEARLAAPRSQKRAATMADDAHTLLSISEVETCISMPIEMECFERRTTRRIQSSAVLSLIMARDRNQRRLQRTGIGQGAVREGDVCSSLLSLVDESTAPSGRRLQSPEYSTRGGSSNVNDRTLFAQMEIPFA